MTQSHAVLLAICLSVAAATIAPTGCEAPNTVKLPPPPPEPKHISKHAPVPAQISHAYGIDSWAVTRYIRFDMVIRDKGHETARYSHLWDRQTGEYRYEADAAVFAASAFYDQALDKWQPIKLDIPPGQLVALLNKKTKRGAVYIDGAQAPDNTATVARVLERIDNDTFLLTQPVELVRAKTTGAALAIKQEDAASTMVYRYHYPPSAGKTPKDLWALFYNPQTMMIFKSKVKPQFSRHIITAEWTRTAPINGVTFCLERVMGEKRIVFEKITMPKNVPDGVFTDPNVQMPW